jgi:hypothetical protein
LIKNNIPLRAFAFLRLGVKFTSKLPGFCVN